MFIFSFSFDEQIKISSPCSNLPKSSIGQSIMHNFATFSRFGNSLSAEFCAIIIVASFNFGSDLIGESSIEIEPAVINFGSFYRY